MPNIHPMMIHFPIALIITTLVVDVLGVALRKKSFTVAGTITTAGALIGAIVAVLTGLFAEDSSWIPGAAHEILETHELFGFIALGVIAMMAVMRLALHDRLTGGLRWLMILMGTIATGVIIFGAYLGGEMVYNHGAGVKAAENCVKDSVSGNGKYDVIENTD